MGSILVNLRRATRRRPAALVLRVFLLTIALGLTIYSTARLVRAHSARQVPTLFPPWPADNDQVARVHHKNEPVITEPSIRLPKPRETAFRTINKQTLDIDNGRYLFVKNLGGGCEGEGKVYIDNLDPSKRKVVIKTFYADTRSNPLPDHLLEVFNPGINSWWWLGGIGPWIFGPAFKFLGMDIGGMRIWGTIKTWPVEIPATLWFSNVEEEGKSHTRGDVVQALDYFYIENRWLGRNWQLVFPFYEDGTMDDLAVMVSRLGLKPHEVDRVYRKNFVTMLDSLNKMHNDGYCHGDVKTDNVFLLPSSSDGSPTATSNHTMTWIIADLGNLREIPHIWHYVRPDPARPPLALNSRMDCRVVDTTRALKSYISFLRQSTSATVRSEEFDKNFYRGEMGWSWIYWKFMIEAGTETEYFGTPVELLKRVFELEEEKRKQVLKEENHNEEEEKHTLDGFSSQVREEVAVLRQELKSWKAKRLGDKPAWINDENIVIKEWLKDVKTPAEPLYRDTSKITSPGNEHNQQPIIQDISDKKLALTIYWELECTANTKDYGLPERIMGKAME